MTTELIRLNSRKLNKYVIYFSETNQRSDRSLGNDVKIHVVARDTNCECDPTFPHATQIKDTRDKMRSRRTERRF